MKSFQKPMLPERVRKFLMLKLVKPRKLVMPRRGGLALPMNWRQLRNVLPTRRSQWWKKILVRMKKGVYALCIHITPH
jgi:hypothetical protein